MYRFIIRLMENFQKSYFIISFIIIFEYYFNIIYIESFLKLENEKIFSKKLIKKIYENTKLL